MPSAQYLNLPNAKQHQIIQVSMSEFAEHGYDLASTNRIVQRAGMSKGVLFKYFVDKEALFLYVCEVSALSYVTSIPNNPADDLFEWVRHTTEYKLRFMQANPTVGQLWIRILREPKHPVYAKANALQSSLLQKFAVAPPFTLPENRLKSGITLEHVYSMFSWIAFGMQEKIIADLPDVRDETFDERMQAIIEEFNVYLGIMKSGIYKEAEPT